MRGKNAHTTTTHIDMIERLTSKQEAQLMRLCEEFQPYLPFHEIVFMELVTAAREYCDSSLYPFLYDKGKRFQELFINRNALRIKSKYYSFGFTASKKPKPLSPKQITLLYRYVPRVQIPCLGSAQPSPTEKVLFIKIVRACRDYLRARMSKEAETILFQRLSLIFDAMK